MEILHTAAENRHSNVVGVSQIEQTLRQRAIVKGWFYVSRQRMRTKRSPEFYRVTEDEEAQLRRRGDPPVASTTYYRT